MNKLRRGILICLAALCLTGACALGETLYLPENLKRIDQEAFYQTVNVDEVVLPEGVTAIGPRAFAESLISRIYLPESLTDIAADAFSSCDNLTAVVHEDSYAHVWCQENGVEFEVIAAPVPYTTQVQANGTLAITGYTGEETALVIPAYVNGVSVTAVADGAFKDNTAIVSVELPATLTTIADEAFSGCLNLEKVTATEESWLASVGSRAFYQCKKLAQFPFTDTLEKIGDEAFSMANIVEADLSSVSGLGKDAFYNNVNLEAVVLPAIARIPDYCFKECLNLTGVTIPEGVEVIGKEAFAHCYSIGEIILPSSVTEIAGGAFASCRALRSLSSLENVDALGVRAFAYCPIGSVTLSDELKTLPWGAFYASGLTEIVIPDSVTMIDEEVFNSCAALETAIVGKSVVSIGYGAFGECPALKQAVLPESLTAIDSGAFDGSGNVVCTVAEGSYAHQWCQEQGVPFVPVASEAQSFVTAELEDGTLAITGYDDNDEAVVIPAAIDGRTVTVIASEAFMRNDRITSVALPATVTTIENMAFYQCPVLKNITVEQGGAPERVDFRAFYGCGALTQFPFADGVTVIGSEAFAASGLTEADLSGVSSLGDCAFGSCAALETVILPAVETVPYRCFEQCGALKSVSLPEGISGIDEGAFAACGMESVALPSTLTLIGDGAFEGCAALAEISSLENVTKIGARAFYGCPLAGVKLSSALTELQAGAFASSGLKEIEIPGSLTAIADEAFAGCQALEKAMIGEGVETVGSGAFSNCAELKEVTLPASLTGIGADAFRNSNGAVCVVARDSYAHMWCQENGVGYKLTVAGTQSYTTAVLADGTLCVIGYEGDATAIVIPEFIDGKAVTAIGESLFAQNSDIVSVDLPATVTEIGNQAFGNCVSLQKVTAASGSRLTSVGSSAFRGCAALTEFPFGGSLRTIGYEAFCGTGLKSVDLSGVTGLGERSFSGSDIRSAVLPAVAELPYGLFSGCAELESVTLPGGVEYIGDEAFYLCGKLSRIDIPATVTSIGGGVFKGCAALTGTISLSNVTELGWEAFENCGLTGVELSEKLDTVPFGAFKGSGLTAVTVPGSVKSIDVEAFSGCASLTAVTLAEGVESIASNAFSGCGSLKQAVLPESLADIAASAFKGSSAVVCTVVENSYAHNWCREIGVGFELKK